VKLRETDNGSRVVYCSNGREYRPQDIVAHTNVSAAVIVCEAATETKLSDYYLRFVTRFLRQWPDGPQIKRKYRLKPHPGYDVTIRSIPIDKYYWDRIPVKSSLKNQFVRDVIATVLDHPHMVSDTILQKYFANRKEVVL